MARSNDERKLESGHERLEGIEEQDDECGRAEAVDEPGRTVRDDAKQDEACHDRGPDRRWSQPGDERVAHEAADDQDGDRATGKAQNLEEFPKNEPDHADMQSAHGKEMQRAAEFEVLDDLVRRVAARSQHHRRDHTRNFGIILAQAGRDGVGDPSSRTQGRRDERVSTVAFEDGDIAANHAFDLRMDALQLEIAREVELAGISRALGSAQDTLHADPVPVAQTVRTRETGIDAVLRGVLPATLPPDDGKGDETIPARAASSRGFRFRFDDTLCDDGDALTGSQFVEERQRAMVLRPQSRVGCECQSHRRDGDPVGPPKDERRHDERRTNSGK